MLKVIGVFHVKEIGHIVSAELNSGELLPIQIGDMLTDGVNTWKIVDIDRFKGGCFGYSPLRGELLLGGDPPPSPGNILIKCDSKDDLGKSS